MTTHPQVDDGVNLDVLLKQRLVVLDLDVPEQQLLLSGG